jgi:hypothetical protein
MAMEAKKRETATTLCLPEALNAQGEPNKDR